MGTERHQSNKISVGIYQRMFQVVDQFSHTLIPAVRTLLGTFQDDLLQGEWQARRILGRSLDLLLQMLDRNGNGRIPVKRNTSGHHLIDGDTQRIDIALIIRIASAHLLR